MSYSGSSVPTFATMLSSLLVVGFFLSARCEAVEKFPNARYLGMGYNVITGNPDNNLHDPGFAFNVLEFTWATGMTTSDGKYFVPDHIQALQTKSCGFHSQATTEFGTRSYQNALSVDVSAEAGGQFWLWGARFTASAGYKKVRNGTSQKHRIYTSARGKCIQYKLSVNYLHAPVNVTSNFAKAVSSLPLARDDSAYNTFINTYGTHFTSRVTMGAKMVVRSEFEEMALTNIEETGLNIETGTKLSFFRSAAGVATETETERQQRETFERMRKSFAASYLGSHPPSDGRWETWAQSTADSPYPVKYRLAPLTSLITDKFFPNMLHDELNTRRNLLTAACQIYCDSTSGCGIPPPDRVPLRMKKAVSSFVGSARVSCPPTYQLLSCGLMNVRTSGPYDRQRYAIPTNDDSCDCVDKAGAKCVPWCSNTVSKFRTAISTLVRGRSSQAIATCPAGYKVLGCHAKHTTDKERWPYHYPLHNGNACSCYNSGGLYCIASCASNIRNHEVRLQYGKGATRVACSAGNVVLGCGIQPKDAKSSPILAIFGKKYEKWRTWAVRSIDSCECYDSFGATCYAICGQLN